MDILSSLSQPWRHSVLRGLPQEAVGGDGNGRKETDILPSWGLVGNFLAKTLRMKSGSALSLLQHVGIHPHGAKQ